MLIYKYVPTPRFFSNFKFRFTPAQDLNDPMELVPVIRLRDPIAYAHGITERNIMSVYVRFLISNPDMSEEEAWERVSEAAKKFEQIFDQSESERNIYEMFMRTTNKYVGVLSLAEDPCVLPMWAHYANEYRGLVIALDSDSEFFQHKPEEPKMCGELMDVNYTDTTPVVYVEPGKLDIPKEIFFTKARSWAYEKEWRMIKYLPQASEVVDRPEGKKIHLFAVPPAAIQEVIFGHRISSDDRKLVEQALRTHAPHVMKKRIESVPGAGLRVVDF